MNGVGIVRNLDSLGRIVIKKYRKGCIFCGSEFDIREYKNIWICSKCRKLLNK